MASSSKKRAPQERHLKWRSRFTVRPFSNRQFSTVKVICTAPHSGHGSGSDVGASLGRDEDIKDVTSYLGQDLPFGVDIEIL